MSRNRTHIRLVAVPLLALLVALPAASGRAQGPDERGGAGDFGFLKLRPTPAKPAAKPAKKPTYRKAPVAAQPAQPAQPAAPKTPLDSDTLVGVTLWRLRPAAKTDVARILTHEEATDTDVEWTPERIDVGTPLGAGHRVRLALETPRDGFLYVVDREVYADGTTSAPVLIFPTTRTRGGDNRVFAGTVVEIPALSDNPVYFTLKRSRPDQVAESISVIIAPRPIEGLTIGRNAQNLTAETFASWEKQWGGPVERIDLDGGLGTVYTEAEKAAGAGAGAVLTQTDAVPQTIYRVAGRSGSPALLTFALKLE